MLFVLIFQIFAPPPQICLRWNLRSIQRDPLTLRVKCYYWAQKVSVRPPPKCYRPKQLSDRCIRRNTDDEPSYEPPGIMSDLKKKAFKCYLPPKITVIWNQKWLLSVIDDAISRYHVIKCSGQNLTVKCYWLTKFGIKCYWDPPPITTLHS